VSVKDLLNLVLFLTIYHYWQGRYRLSTSREWIFGSWCELDHWENWV
jgi:hypothetical protein